MKPKHLTKTQAKVYLAKLGETLITYEPIVDKDSFCNPCSFANGYVIRQVNQLWKRKAEAEVSAIEFARKNTTIPVPEIVYWGKDVIIYKKIEGENLQKIWSSLSQKEKRKYMRQAIEFAEQMQTYSFACIGSLYGEKIGSHVDTQRGPFLKLDDFLLALYDKPVKSVPKGMKEIFAEYRKHIIGYSTPIRFVFTHADLTPKNLLVKKGKIVGVIDWEWSGSYPTYSDYSELQWCDDDLRKKSRLRTHYPQKFIEICEMISNASRFAYYKDWNIKNEKAFLAKAKDGVDEIMAKYRI